ncbi:MAG: hypothetical protein ACYDEJ_12895 [Desulfitobacteriaceae bacterium]
MQEKRSINDKKALKWTAILAAIATSILAITALVTVYVTVSAWKEERQSARPYLSLKESPKIEAAESLNFEFIFNNVGVHPVTNLASKTLVFNDSLANLPIHNDEFDLVNEIPKGNSSGLLISLDKKDLDPVWKNATPYFIVIRLSYSDPILKEEFNQIVFMKWNGINNGKIQPIIHVRAAEKAKILEYFSLNKIDPNSTT